MKVYRIILKIYQTNNRLIPLALYKTVRAALWLELVPSVMAMLPKPENFSFFNRLAMLRYSACRIRPVVLPLAIYRTGRETQHHITATLKECDKLFFSNVSTIVHISAEFPVTSCEYERSSSTPRLLKTYLRSTMGQGRLTYLALMDTFVHPQRHISEHIKDSYRFCKEATEKDYFTRHFI